MCQYKSAIAMKGKIILAPDGKESHGNLLESLGLDDNTYNAMKKFVRLELIPPNGNRAADISKWTFIIDQDIIPDWYTKDPGKYEEMLRKEVENHLKNSNMVNICGYSWTSIKKEDCTYYIMDGCLDKMFFGENNNFAKSDIFKMLNNCNLNKELQETFGDTLLNITTDLKPYSGNNIYGTVESKLTLPTMDFIRENFDKIPLIIYNEGFWTATPYETRDCVFCYCNHMICYANVYEDGLFVRPMFVLKN